MWKGVAGARRVARGFQGCSPLRCGGRRPREDVFLARAGSDEEGRLYLSFSMTAMVFRGNEVMVLSRTFDRRSTRRRFEESCRLLGYIPDPDDLSIWV